MPPAARQVPMFAAEPSQEPLPYGRWGEALGEQFASAAPDGIAVEAADIAWFPERTWNGRTYVPATVPAGGGEVFGYVSYTREHEGAQAADFLASADFTEETADQNPDWTLDLSDEEIGQWRGTEGRRGVITLVSVDAYTGDYVEVRLYGARGAELARESLYEDDE